MTFQKLRYGIFLFLTASLGASGARAQLPEEYSKHVATAKTESLFDWTGVVARNCLAPKTGPAIGNYESDPGHDVYYAEPEKVFDNLYFLGTKFHTSWALKTSAGIILIDTLYNYAVEPEIVEGLKKEGLDPAEVKYVLITHGHSDHDEGATYFQQKYGARVVLGAADWDVLAKAKKPMPGGTPKRDLAAQDNGKITLGDTTVTTILTPGHTPGAYGLIFNVTDHGKPATVVYASGTAFSGYDKTFFDTFIASQKKLAGAAAAAGATVLISNHTAFDEAWTKVRLAAWRPAGEPNPFVIGTIPVQNYFKVMVECSLAWESLPSAPQQTQGE